MANVIGKFTDELEQGVKEVASDVKDAVGEAIEQNAQTAVGPVLTPAQTQQKQLDDQKEESELRRQLDFHKQTEADLKKVQQENKQKEDVRLQAQQQEEQQKQVKKLEEKKAVPPKPGQPIDSIEREEIARIRQESGKGHGVGG